jgi:undecaprenyl-diphosphatase
MTVGVADQLSSELIKKKVERLRPCRETQLQPAARTLVHCGGGYSFTSSHATNHFAVAVFIFFSWGLCWKRWRWLLLLWAASISLGQVYVGVHYPLDILVGAINGSILGYLGSLTYKRLKKWRIEEFYTSETPTV